MKLLLECLNNFIFVLYYWCWEVLIMNLDKNSSTIIENMSEDNIKVFMDRLLAYKKHLEDNIASCYMKIESLNEDVDKINACICSVSGHKFTEFKKYDEMYQRRCTVCGKVERYFDNSIEDFVVDGSIKRK